jgi:hypothetical protein
MPDIYDDNLTINPGTGGAVVATDYYQDAHYQVMKVAFGNTGEATRVNSSTGLPVNLVTSGANVSTSITSIGAGVKVGINGNVAVFGVAGATAVGVTASNFGIRALTAGDPTTAGAAGQDTVRIVGYSGGWAVGVTATNFGIRALTAGDPTTAGAAGQDVVRIVGYSGGWAVGVTAVDLDIRSLTYGSDSVSVLNTVTVSASQEPFVSAPSLDTVSFKTRVLRASNAATPHTSMAAISSQYLIDGGNAEDTVRVVGLSGAWPVSVFSHGLTNINNYNTKVPFSVDSTGALFVNLAGGSISVTADVGSLSIGDVTVSGISLGYPSTLSKTISIVGYTGSDTIPVAVTGSVGIFGQGLTHLSNIATNTGRVLGASGDYVGLTGAALTALTNLETTEGPVGGKYLQVFELNSAATNTALSSISADSTVIKNIFQQTSTSPNKVASQVDGVNAIHVDVKRIAQPTGGTANKVAVSTSGGVNTFSSVALQSGVHFRSDLNNTGAIFIGFSSAVSSQVGFPLYNGDQIFIETDNLNRLQAWSTVNGATLYYIGT